MQTYVVTNGGDNKDQCIVEAESEQQALDVAHEAYREMHKYLVDYPEYEYLTSRRYLEVHTLEHTGGGH